MPKLPVRSALRKPEPEIVPWPLYFLLAAFLLGLFVR